MKRIAILVLLLCALAPAAYAQLDTQAAQALVDRVVPTHSKYFDVRYIPANEGKDVFGVESRNGKIVLSGNNGVSVASALNYYLKNYCNFEITWNGSSTDMPGKLPVVKEPIRRETPHELRYYLNYCTFSYSMAWWDWERWEREIDWMAMNGINLPLAITGQEAVWRKVYNDMGFSDSDLEDFFTGPGYLGWFYMNCMDAWGGPLPRSWIDGQRKLQEKILKRQRGLGITPVLPAFTGHVPKSLARKYPDARIDSVNWHGNFPHVYMLNPNDPLFSEIGERFLRQQTKMYGTDHYYSSDIFNELVPPSDDPDYLAKTTRKVYEVMRSVDPDAVWVMQAWLFVSADGRKFWTPERMKAFLGAVPDDKMVVLDLYTENRPRWRNTEGFYGKKWIWNMLHNFGGNHGMFGKAQLIAAEPSRVNHDIMKENYSGIGLTMEAIEQNPMIYHLMLEHVWRDTPIDLDEWINGYITRRYGRLDPDARKAWDVFLKTVYMDNNKDQGPAESILSGRPTFDRNSYWTWTDLYYYDNRDFAKGWESMVRASERLAGSDGFQYDLVDATRQAMANYATALQRQMAHTYYAGDAENYAKLSERFLELLSDLDRLLKTRQDFLLGKWIDDARAWGVTAAEKDLYEFNARNLVSMWGHRDIAINDYSARHWSGLVEHYYRERWKHFFDQTLDALKKGEKWDQDRFNEFIKDWEWNWVNQKGGDFAVAAQGDPIAVSREMFDKYFETVSRSNVFRQEK